jgi:hypothetical protein
MLVRDVNGKINIISRKNCKNDSVYYDKLFAVRLEYTKKYKSIIVYPNIHNPKDDQKSNPKVHLNNLSDD